jgi:hypothetical protein
LQHQNQYLKNEPDRLSQIIGDVALSYLQYETSGFSEND